MSKRPPCFLPLALLLGLGTLAGAAPRKRAVPALPPLIGAPTPPAASTTTTSSPTAAPAAGVGETSLYGGEDPGQAGLTLAGWGGGSAADSTALSLENGHSIQVTTINEYQGAKIIFNTPVSLGDMSPTRFLQMSLHFPKVDAQALSGRGGGRFGRGGGRNGRGGRRGGFGGNGPDPTNPPVQEESPTPVITSLRWVLTLADGRQTEVRRPLPEEVTTGQNWFSLAVPLSVLQFQAGAPSPLQSIIVAADGYAQFSVGAIKIVTDDTPITAEAGHTQTVRSGTEVLFHGTADAGPSSLRYSWNFGTSDGDPDQAEGQTVQTAYFTGGKDYTVTLTVSDVNGVKKPAASTVTVHVR